MLLTICGLILCTFVLGRRWISLSKPSVVSKENNPNDFYLWQSATGFEYTFRYDPRAADEWRFGASSELKDIPHRAGKPGAVTTNDETTGGKMKR